MPSPVDPAWEDGVTSMVVVVAGLDASLRQGTQVRNQEHVCSSVFVSSTLRQGRSSQLRASPATPTPRPHDVQPKSHARPSFGSLAASSTAPVRRNRLAATSTFVRRSAFPPSSRNSLEVAKLAGLVRLCSVLQLKEGSGLGRLDGRCCLGSLAGRCCTDLSVVDRW